MTNALVVLAKSSRSVAGECYSDGIHPAKYSIPGTLYEKAPGMFYIDYSQVFSGNATEKFIDLFETEMARPHNAS